MSDRHDRLSRERAIRTFSVSTPFAAHVLIPCLLEVRPIYWRLVVDSATRGIDVLDVLLAEAPGAYWSLPKDEIPYRWEG